MIPHQAALLLWIVLSALFMADKNNARGFSLALVLGILFLPAKYGIELPGVPDLDKNNVAAIGIFIGTVIFHPRLFDRFRITVPDFLILGMAFFAFATSAMNNFGIYDGISQIMGVFLNFALIVLLARIHLGTPRSMRTFLLVLVGAGVLYMPFAVYEFRMSPQIHTMTYGYFQHVFQQHARGGFWRPIVYFDHALYLGRFFAFTAFLALLPMRKDLCQYLGRWGNFLFLAPLLGLVISQSFGPYILFLLLCGGYLVIHRHPWAGYALPVLAFLWLAIVFAGIKLGYGITENIASFSPGRAGTLDYRLAAIQEYKDIIINRFWLGYGGWGHGRIEGRATDSQTLIRLLSRGFIGSLLYFGWWFVAMHTAYRVMRRTEGTVFSKRARGIALLTSIALAVAVIDTALDLHLIACVAGLMTIDSWLRRRPNLPTLNKPPAHPAAPPRLRRKEQQQPARAAPP